MGLIVFILIAINIAGFYYIWQKQSKLKKIQDRYGDIVSRDAAVQKLDKQSQGLQKKVAELEAEKATKETQIKLEIEQLESRLRELEEEDFIQSHGFYKSKYNFDSSEEYQLRLDAIRENQKLMIKNKGAAICETDWTIDGSRRKGQKMINDYLKLVLRAFNGECDASISKVKYNNVQVLEKRINKAFEALNKLASINQIRITRDFLKLKLEELGLCPRSVQSSTIEA